MLQWNSVMDPITPLDKEPNITHVEDPVVIVGDIHG
jgi:hypothetical protein